MGYLYFFTSLIPRLFYLNSQNIKFIRNNFWVIMRIHNKLTNCDDKHVHFAVNIRSIGVLYAKCPRRVSLNWDNLLSSHLLSKFAFSALTLSVGQQGGHSAYKKLRVVGCWRGSVWSEVQTCTRSSWCHCHSLSLAPVTSRLVLPFWYRLTRVVPDKWPLNGCVCVCYYM